MTSEGYRIALFHFNRIQGHCGVYLHLNEIFTFFLSLHLGSYLLNDYSHKENTNVWTSLRLWACEKFRR